MCPAAWAWAARGRAAAMPGSVIHSLIPWQPRIVPGGGAGFLQTTVQPGVIVEVPMANMALSPDGRAMLDIDNIHIKADACGGYVTIRSYAYLRVATAVAHTGFAVYGDPLRI